MQAILDFVVKHVMAFWPLARVYSWQQGVRVRLGKLREELEPGIHWRWPFVDEVFKVSTAEYTLDLRAGAITTSDGHSIAVSANLAYRIVSVRTMWQNVADVDESIQNMALGFLTTECARRSGPELLGDRTEMQGSLASFMTAELAAWGVEVTRVCLTDLVRAKQYRLFMDATAPMRGQG